MHRVGGLFDFHTIADGSGDDFTDPGCKDQATERSRETSDKSATEFGGARPTHRIKYALDVSRFALSSWGECLECSGEIPIDRRLEGLTKSIP